MSLKKSTILITSALFLLAISTFAEAGHRYYGSHHGYTDYRSSAVIDSNPDCPEDRPDVYYHSHRHHHHGHGYHPHRTNNVYIEKHVYHHQAPARVIYQQPQPTYYQPAPVTQYSTYNRGNIVGDTLIGGALGAAAGAAIGAVTGNPAAGAQIGAVVGGFGGISRGVLGRGLIW